MGLLDVLNGMQNDPRGERTPPESNSSSSGGMSPITMAILGLLAYKAVKHFTNNQNQQTSTPASGGASAPVPPGGLGGALGGLLGGGAGGLGDILKGGLGSGLGGTLGGALAGGAAGSVLSGGLGDLMKQLQNNGLGDEANSWVSSGPNKQVSPDDLGKALGADQINTLATQTGMSADDLLANLAQHLPNVINDLTPDGRLPSEQEVSRMI
jgi:uncharacterized protein YidB (DUF937 family)